jgi:hypothetical protein
MALALEGPELERKPSGGTPRFRKQQRCAGLRVELLPFSYLYRCQ